MMIMTLEIDGSVMEVKLDIFLRLYQFTNEVVNLFRLALRGLM